MPSVISLWTSAADKHGYFVVALGCTTDIGCTTGNFSGWVAGSGYRITKTNIDLINAQAAKVEAHDIDTKREYISGHSP